MSWMRIAATPWAFRHPSKQQGAVRRGLLQPAALTGHRLEHPAQALRHGLVGRHGGASLICRPRSKVSRVRLVIAQCTVDYVGRLTAHLPSARRLLLFKADGSVSVHADDRAYKPLNWMSPPCWLTEEARRRGAGVGGGEQGRRAAAHHGRGDRARLQPRSGRRSRLGQGWRRGPPAGVARRARPTAGRGIHVGPPRVHDRDRARRSVVPRRTGWLGRGGNQAARRDRRRGAAHPLSRVAEPRQRSRAGQRECSPPSRSSRRRAPWPPIAGSVASHWITTRCAAWTATSTGCSDVPD